MIVTDTSLNPYRCNLCHKTHKAHENIPHELFTKRHWSVNAATRPLNHRPLEFALMSVLTQKIAA